MLIQPNLQTIDNEAKYAVTGVVKGVDNGECIERKQKQFEEKLKKIYGELVNQELDDVLKEICRDNEG